MGSEMCIRDRNSNSSGLGLTYYTRLFVMLYFYNKSPLGRIKTRRHGIGCQSFVSEIITEMSSSHAA